MASNSHKGSNPSTLVQVDPVCPDEGVIRKAGKLLEAKGVVIFPTLCLYGVGANALDPDAVSAVFDLKQRPATNPILVLVKNRAMLDNFVKAVPKAAETLMQAFWPGNLTLIFEAAACVSHKLTAGTGKIGIRLPAHPVAKALVEAVDFPVTGTSANISGFPGAITAQTLHDTIVRDADLVLDAGKLSGGYGSTIVDVTGDQIQILREGTIATQDIYQVLGK